MISWLSANYGTLLVGFLVLAAVFAVVLNMIRNKKQGKSSCGCGCSGCPHSCACHAPATTPTNPQKPH